MKFKQKAFITGVELVDFTNSETGEVYQSADFVILLDSRKENAKGLFPSVKKIQRDNGGWELAEEFTTPGEYDCEFMVTNDKKGNTDLVLVSINFPKTVSNK